MERVIEMVDLALMVLFGCCFAYQGIYLVVGLVKKEPVQLRPAVLHRFAVLIPARNEAAVISALLDSIRDQDYPAEQIDIYVIADNCTDDTAAVAARAGAEVIRRFDRARVGKGYALDYALREIDRRTGLEHYDAYLVFDADNVLDRGYFTAINGTFSQGYEVVTSYRNSKNYGDNWITAGYALWFLRESRFLNGARMKLGISCAISGTGFLVSARILREDGGWGYHLLTEDIEFTADHIIRGHKIGYCKDAVLYDEQPDTFRTSWDQRLRWTKGFYQVLGRYGGALTKGAVLRHSFQCYDMLMVIASGTLISLAALLFNGSCMLVALAAGRTALVRCAGLAVVRCLSGVCRSIWLVGLVTLIAEREQIHCSVPRRFFYLLLLPLFIFTYIPMALVAAVKKDVTWKRIPHSIHCTAEQICERK